MQGGPVGRAETGEPALAVGDWPRIGLV